MKQSQCVLIIEDDPSILEMLRTMLTKAGFDVVTAADAPCGLRAAYRTHPDAVILDIMLPEMDGFEACWRLREMTDIPILFLTGRANSSDDVAKGLDLGADAYMTKPVGYAELVSRVRAALRRAEPTRNGAVDCLSPTPAVILDCGRHEVTVGNRTVYLCPKEFEVLEYLIRHTGHVLSPDAILLSVWGAERIGDEHLIKQYIYQLRKKIEAEPQKPNYIQSIPSQGYYFRPVDPL
jgi:two-component system KDP operon response regulator KdpE